MPFLIETIQILPEDKTKQNQVRTVLQLSMKEKDLCWLSEGTKGVFGFL